VLVAPEALPELVPGDDLERALDEGLEEAERLGLEGHQSPGAEQAPLLAVEGEAAEEESR